MARNIQMHISEDNLLTITIDLSQTFGRSKSGKTTIVASTDGNLELEKFPRTFVGVNVYKK